MNIEIFRTFSSVICVDLVIETDDEELFICTDSTGLNPLNHSRQLRQTLKTGALSQTVPFLMQDSFHCFYAAFRAADLFIYMGPMCHERLTHIQRRQMFRNYGIEADGLPELPAFSLPEMVNMLRLACHIAGRELPETDVIEKNHIFADDALNIRKDQTRHLLREEEEDDDKAFRHSYHEELLLLQAVKEGNGKEAVRLAEKMDRDSGRLSARDLQHRKNMAIVGITLCSRAAIEGGITPEAAYRLSGYYIRKCDAAQDTALMLKYRNQAVREFTDYVLEKQKLGCYSGYTEQCRDYVRKHYREKIYLQDIADSLGISSSYLSRLFKKETGQCLQDFINEERVYRASNLLQFSDLSLSEIAQYVHFPSQSYFGSIFKKLKGMTPKEYRDRFKTREFGKAGK